MSTREQGMKAEVYARQFLVKQGLVWLMSNYACRMGEIDLVMQSAQGELCLLRCGDARQLALAVHLKVSRRVSKKN